MRKLAILAVLSTVLGSGCTAGTAVAETHFDVLTKVHAPDSAQVFMHNVADATVRVCGEDQSTLYFRGCSDDVNAFIKASLTVSKKKSYSGQRKAHPEQFTNVSYKLF